MLARELLDQRLCARVCRRIPRVPRSAPPAGGGGHGRGNVRSSAGGTLPGRGCARADTARPAERPATSQANSGQRQPLLRRHGAFVSAALPASRAFAVAMTAALSGAYRRTQAGAGRRSRDATGAGRSRRRCQRRRAERRRRWVSPVSSPMTMRARASTAPLAMLQGGHQAAAMQWRVPACRAPRRRCGKQQRAQATVVQFAFDGAPARIGHSLWPAGVGEQHRIGRGGRLAQLAVVDRGARRPNAGGVSALVPQPRRQGRLRSIACDRAPPHGSCTAARPAARAHWRGRSPARPSAQRAIHALFSSPGSRARRGSAACAIAPWRRDFAPGGRRQRRVPPAPQGHGDDPIDSTCRRGIAANLPRRASRSPRGWRRARSLAKAARAPRRPSRRS